MNGFSLVLCKYLTVKIAIYLHMRPSKCLVKYIREGEIFTVAIACFSRTFRSMAPVPILSPSAGDSQSSMTSETRYFVYLKNTGVVCILLLLAIIVSQQVQRGQHGRFVKKCGNPNHNNWTRTSATDATLTFPSFIPRRIIDEFRELGAVGRRFCSNCIRILEENKEHEEKEKELRSTASEGRNKEVHQTTATKRKFTSPNKNSPTTSPPPAKVHVSTSNARKQLIFKHSTIQENYVQSVRRGEITQHTTTAIQSSDTCQHCTEYGKEVQKLQERIETLSTEKNDMTEEVDMLKRERVDLLQRNEQLQDEKDTLYQTEEKELQL
ncbi:uncharacterized protein [Ptychodera flava]|uniref:uncharacterized protein n=1 Tax=Ptychodera flava TaxID=63121 RepID=UPI003969FDE5